MNGDDAGRKERATVSRFSMFEPLDQLDWLIIIVAVLAGTLAKRYRLLSLPAWFLDWPLLLLLIVAGDQMRRVIGAAVAKRRVSRQAGS